MNKKITMAVLALAFVATATLAPAAQAMTTSSTTATTTAVTASSTATTTAPVATTTTTVATTTPNTGNSTIAGLLAQLAKLTTLFNELKAKMMGTKVEIKELRADIKEGMTGADVKTIQELLASDPTIYPAGLVTGFFGPMTKEAIMRFQTKNGLEVTGEIDAETRAAMDTIIEARRAEGKFPIGLLLAPGLKDKFKELYNKRCEGTVASSTAAMMCAKVKAKYMDKMEDEVKMMDEKKDMKKMGESMMDGKKMDDKKSTSTATTTAAN